MIIITDAHCLGTFLVYNTITVHTRNRARKGTASCPAVIRVTAAVDVNVAARGAIAMVATDWRRVATRSDVTDTLVETGGGIRNGGTASVATG